MVKNDLINRRELARVLCHLDATQVLKHCDFHSLRVFDQVQAAMFKSVLNAPAIDAVPVVHAMWAYTDEGYKVCANCCWEHPVLDNDGFTVADTFCPSCGAKMEGGADDAAD